MPGIVRDEDFRIDIGRATGGRTFVRVVHVPTQASQTVVGLNGRSSATVIQQLLTTVIKEIEAIGWCSPRETPEKFADLDTRRNERRMDGS